VRTVCIRMHSFVQALRDGYGRNECPHLCIGARCPASGTLFFHAKHEVESGVHGQCQSLPVTRLRDPTGLIDNQTRMWITKHVQDVSRRIYLLNVLKEVHWHQLETVHLSAEERQQWLSWLATLCLDWLVRSCIYVLQWDGLDYELDFVYEDPRVITLPIEKAAEIKQRYRLGPPLRKRRDLPKTQ
jgi:hypothetical protein